MPNPTTPEPLTDRGHHPDCRFESFNACRERWEAEGRDVSHLKSMDEQAGFVHCAPDCPHRKRDDEYAKTLTPEPLTEDVARLRSQLVELGVRVAEQTAEIDAEADRIIARKAHGWHRVAVARLEQVAGCPIEEVIADMQLEVRI